MTGNLTIELLSDTCFSAPAALGESVQTDVGTDDLGLPFVSGKTLHGLLRDTWLSCRQYVDSERVGESLLGKVRSHEAEGVLRIGNGRMSESTRRFVEHARKRHKPVPEKAIRDAFSTTRTVTSVDRKTGAPKTETLRTMRVVPAGTRLHAAITTSRDLTDDERGMLVRLLSLTRHAGLARNRGLGHVRMTLTWHASALRSMATPEQPTPRTSVPPLELPCPVFIHYRLTLTEPLLITDRQTDPNSCTTLPFVSGAAMRGAIAAALERNGLAQDQIERIVASGDVRFLNAYREVEARRSHPTPITFWRIKDARLDDADAQATDVLGTLFGSKKYPDLPACQRQPINARHVAPTGSSYAITEIKKRANTHQTRDRETGVTWNDEESESLNRPQTPVYGYESLEPGQSFIGSIALQPDDDARSAICQALTAGKLWLGRSARSGYGGQPEVELLEPPDFSPECEWPTGARALNAGDEFEVLLTSDAILRNQATGQIDPEAFGDELASRFKGVADVVRAGTCIRYGRVRAFNRLWRTELPEVPCAAAGSVALMRAVAGLPALDIRQLQSTAIGERIAEGCGCFTIVKDSLIGITLRHVDAPGPPDIDGLTEDSDLIAAQKRLYRWRHELWSLAYLQELVEPLTSVTLSVSLIQRLRMPLRLPTNWQAAYEAWLYDGPLMERRKNRLRPRAYNAVCQMRLGSGADGGENDTTLADLLREAAGPDWLPPIREWDRDRSNFRLVSESQADTQWRDAASGMAVYYVDLLLAMLAQKKRKEEPGDARES
jgi:CRISPR-associated protein Csx10